MKKIIILYIICIVSLFFLPVFFVKEYKFKNEEFSETSIKIKLQYSETNEIVEMDLDEYIMGVLIGEMPVDYDIEALKAQAVVARTYTLNKMINSQASHENADMCDNINHCQAYKTKEYALSCWDDKEENEKWSKIKRAVLETQGEVITYEGKLINAFFHANSGGRTEDIVNIWGHENIPYLKTVEGNEVDNRPDKVTLNYNELNKIMKEKYPEYINVEKESFNSGESNENSIIKIIEKNSSGRVSKLQINNIVLEGTDARTIFELRSTFFDINIAGDNVTFNTQGYGHGIGLSQDGANSMASQGKTYEEIITHYYTGVILENYYKL